MAILGAILVGSCLTVACAAWGVARLRAMWMAPPAPAVSIGIATPSSPASPPPSKPAPDPMKTLSIRIKNRDVQEVADLLDTLRGARGTITTNASKRTIRIVDRSSEVDRMARIVREVDEPSARRQKIGIFGSVCEADVTARTFTRVFMQSDLPKRGAKISKIIPAKREALLIVVANDAGLKRISSARLYDCPSDDTLQTRAIRLENRDVHEVTRLLDDVKSARGRVEADEAWGGLRITDLPTEANFLVHIARRLDEYPASRPKLQVRGVLADVLAEMFRRSRSVAPCHGKYSVENIDPACRAHATAWAIGPAGDDKRMVVVADEAGYAEIKRMILHGCLADPGRR